jgi:hypothetical protein
VVLADWVVIDGAVATPPDGAKATPRYTVLLPAMASAVLVAVIAASYAAVSSTLTSWFVVVEPNSSTPLGVIEPVRPRTPPPGRNVPRAVQVVPSKEYFRMPPLLESSAT